MKNIFEGGYIITQGFGKENTAKDYLSIYQAYGLRGHEGIDFVPNNKIMDWRVFAKHSGKVVKINNLCNNTYGKYITIWDKSIKKAFQYCHLLDVKVNLGDKVSKDDYIADMGGSGMTDGQYAPHLHLNCIPVNRLGYRNGDKKNGYMGLINPSPYL